MPNIGAAAEIPHSIPCAGNQTSGNRGRGSAQKKAEISPYAEADDVFVGAGALRISSGVVDSVIEFM